MLQAKKKMMQDKPKMMQDKEKMLRDREKMVQDRELKILSGKKNMLQEKKYDERQGKDAAGKNQGKDTVGKRKKMLRDNENILQDQKKMLWDRLSFPPRGSANLIRRKQWDPTRNLSCKFLYIVKI